MGNPWTKQEVEILKEKLPELGLAGLVAAGLLNRSEGAIKQRGLKLGLKNYCAGCGEEISAEGEMRMRAIRVFPRKTAMTPGDDYAFVGDPPLWRPEADEVHVSVTFTWDIEEGRRLQEAWAAYYPIVKIGGPAISGSYGEFIPGMYLKQGVTITSRGCPYRCPWCLVPSYEGNIKTLPIRPGWIVQDNNLLATPREHQENVFVMLREQRRRVSFPGGLDTRLFTHWTAVQLYITPVKEVFFAADSKGALPFLREAVEKLPWMDRRQLRCYVLIAYGGETTQEATRRLEAVWAAGCLPFAQLYQPAARYIDYPREWKALARTWSRPAAMFALHKAVM